MAITLLTIFAVTAASLLVVAFGLHGLKRVGLASVTAWLSRAPGLDLIIFYFTTVPMIAGPVAGVRLMPETNGWLAAGLGFVAAVAGQFTTIIVWTIAHELAHRDAVRGPRIVQVLNKSVGRWRNHAALWWMTGAVPFFSMVRIAEIILYPPIVWLVRLPRYNHGEWVNVSRHKFDGLVGHDLIWCLYCDWMTGIWSLGSEMLRNIESFWCPIRFSSTNKCVNCKTDFPDIEGGWVAADGTMAEVVAVLEKHYGPTGTNAWFGHPARLTIEGEEPKPDTE